MGIRSLDRYGAKKQGLQPANALGGDANGALVSMFCRPPALSLQDARAGERTIAVILGNHSTQHDEVRK